MVVIIVSCTLTVVVKSERLSDSLANPWIRVLKPSEVGRRDVVFTLSMPVSVTQTTLSEPSEALEIFNDSVGEG
jgi:hypothetical protein